MSSTNVRIVIDADTAGAVTGVQKVSGALDGLAKTAKTTSASADGLTKATDGTGVSADNVGRTFTKSGKIFKSTGRLFKSSGLDAAASGTAFLSTIPALSGVSTAVGGLVLGMESLSQVAGKLGPKGFAVIAGAALIAGAAYLIFRDKVGAAESALRVMDDANRASIDSHREAAAAVWAHSGAVLSLEGAVLGEEEAQLRLREAREATAEALESGGAGSQRYHDALLAQERATRKVTDAEKEHGKGSLEHRTALSGQAAAIRKVDEALKAGGKGSLEYQRRLLEERRAELDLVASRRARAEATREETAKRRDARKELREDIAAAEAAVRATGKQTLASRLGVLQGKDAEAQADKHAKALRRLNAANEALARATVKSGGSVKDLNSAMATLRSKAIAIKVDSRDAIFKIAQIIGQMAIVASKTITLTVKTNHVEGSWNDQETIENLRKEPAKRSFEIDFRSRGTGNLESWLASVTNLQGQLDRIAASRSAKDRRIALTDAQSALAEARKKNEGIVAAERALERARQDIVVAGVEKRLAIAQRGADRERGILERALDAARSLASSIGAAIDAGVSGRLDALDNSPQAKRIREIEAAQKREANRREFGQLNANLAAAQTPEEKAAAQQAINDFMLEQEKQALTEYLDKQRETVTEEGEIKKAGAERQIADLESSLEKGLIKGRAFNTALLKIFRDSGVDWQDAGSLMGAAFVSGLGDQIRALSPAVAKALGFGSPGARSGVKGMGGADRPGGLKKYETGVDYVPQTGPAILHTGEAVLNRSEAAEWRAGRGGSGSTVIFADGMGWLRQFMRVEMNTLSEGARRRALAAGSVR